MASYRYQVVSVGLWRGQIKRWNTTLHRTVSSATGTIYTTMQKSGYKAPGDVAGACSGGVASITVYNATGGAPISQMVYFDWATPSTWIPYTGEYWASVPAGTPVDASGESALVVVGHMPGLSITGKPVTTRKYLHAIPSRSAASYSDPDVDAATITAFLAGWGPTMMVNPAGVAPTTVTVNEWYGNHQRVRGKRRKVATLQQEAYAAGVTVGASAAAGGGGEPFQAR